MEEVGTQLAPTLCIYNSLGPMAKKRSVPFQNTNFMLQQQQQQQQQQYFQRLIPSLDESRNSWNPKNWEWDSSKLVAKPLDMMEISREQERQQQNHQSVIDPNPDVSKKNPVSQTKEDARLFLQLGGGGGVDLVSGEESVTRPSKRVRSRSPGSGNYPMCQVDNCKEDLSAAKDYHRRHKVCEVHSKAEKALVGKQMQRFCQQCSRLVN